MDAMTFTPEWLVRQRCPSCGQGGNGTIGRLGIYNYIFGSRRIPLPRYGVSLARCGACGLAYKVTVPTPRFLKTITMLEQSSLWLPAYNFAAELAAIRAYQPDAAYDLLDIGAAGGEFLRAAGDGPGRRSALDIVRFDRLTVSSGGEFIRGLIDDPELQWSGTPYDVVTVFDVFEHLYAPAVALANLRTLTRPGGIVVIETGSTDAVRARDLDHWYYLAYFEHHIAWNAGAIAAIADRFAFDVVSLEAKRHKLHEKPVFDLKGMLKYCGFKLSPALYHALQYWGGFDGSTPARPNARDHMRIVLRRRP